jgi:hypothetical protein
MPISQVLVTAWICNFCARGETHAAGNSAGLAAAHFVEVLRWETTPTGAIICDRCKAAGLGTTALAAAPSK